MRIFASTARFDIVRDSGGESSTRGWGQGGTEGGGEGCARPSLYAMAWLQAPSQP